uniref:Uncharacterized protein n=1 Tax=Sciurus vulgaris TaxID=55149 RepID=A0A8D2BBX4_SCIVU
ITFEDVAMGFTWQEWGQLAPAQKHLYRGATWRTSGLPVSKPHVIWQLEEEEVTRMSLPRTDWKRRLQAQVSRSSQGISKDLFQIAAVEKHLPDERWSSKLKATCACDAHRLEMQQVKQRHLREMPVTGRSTPTLRTDHRWSGQGRSAGLSPVLKPTLNQHNVATGEGAYQNDSQGGHPERGPCRGKECGKPFHFQSELRRHQRCHTGCHTGEKSYVCSKCGCTFGHISSLIRHWRTHTGEKSYECSKCGHTFGRRSSPSCITGSTRRRPYRCGKCGRAFSQSASLTQHHRLTPGNLPCESSKCRKALRCRGGVGRPWSAPSAGGCPVRHQAAPAAEEPPSHSLLLPNTGSW